MMKHTTAIFFVAVFGGTTKFAGVALGAPPTIGTANVNKDGLALEGYDPVTYFSAHALKQGPVKGQPSLFVERSGVKYLFSTEANRQEFLKKPERFEPAFGGWCAYAVAKSKEKVSVDPKSFLVQEGRLLLFYNGFFADTRKKWTSTTGVSAQQYLRDADLNWPETMNKEP
jgi:YHS domain-containing protein